MQREKELAWITYQDPQNEVDIYYEYKGRDRRDFKNVCKIRLDIQKWKMPKSCKI